MADLAAGLLVAHRKDQNGTSWGPKWVATPTNPSPRMYRVSFLWAFESVGCPVEGCGGRKLTRTNLRIHFLNRHMQDMIVIMEEGNRPHP